MFLKVETTVTGVGTMAPAGKIDPRIGSDTAISTTFSFPDAVLSMLRGRVWLANSASM